MKRPAVEFVTFRLATGEWDKLCATLAEDGYEATGQGIHDWIFDLIADSSDDDEDEEEDDPEPTNPGLEKLFKYVTENPEAVKKAASMGKGFLFNVIKKKMGL